MFVSKPIEVIVKHDIKYHLLCLKCLDITKNQAPALQQSKSIPRATSSQLSSRPTSPLPYMNDVIDAGQDWTDPKSVTVLRKIFKAYYHSFLENYHFENRNKFDSKCDVLFLRINNIVLIHTIFVEIYLKNQCIAWT